MARPVRFIAVAALVLVAGVLALACDDPEPSRPATSTPTPTATPTATATATATPTATAAPPADDEGGLYGAEASAYGMEYLGTLTARMIVWTTASSGMGSDPTPSLVRGWRDATVALAEVEPHARAASCAHELDDMIDDLLGDFAVWLADSEAALLDGATVDTTGGDRILETIWQDVLPALGVCETALRAGAEGE